MRRAWLLALLSCICFSSQAAPPYAKRPEVRAYIKEMVARHRFVEKELVYLFSRVKREDAVLQAIAAPAEKVRTWQEYREMLVNERRIAGGAAFWRAQGFTVKPVDVSSIYRLNGSLGCLVNVLGRD